MLDVEVVGLPAPARAGGGRDAGQLELPDAAGVRALCIAAAARAGVRDGHLAVEFVDAERIATLNGEHRGKPLPTDVLSFPIDGAAPEDAVHAHGPERELGDIVICIEHTRDVREAIVHGVLHLLGMDHETDGGEMLALQRDVLARAHADAREHAHSSVAAHERASAHERA
jgi:probable rRNA maturation factor